MRFFENFDRNILENLQRDFSKILTEIEFFREFWTNRDFYKKLDFSKISKISKISTENDRDIF